MSHVDHSKCQICHHPGVSILTVCPICGWSNEESLERSYLDLARAELARDQIPSSKLHFDDQAARYIVSWKLDYDLRDFDFDALSKSNGCTPNEFKRRRLEAIFKKLNVSR